MANERRKNDPIEVAKNAASGYGVVVLSAVCFILLLAVLATIVRIIIGASAGA